MDADRQTLMYRCAQLYVLFSTLKIWHREFFLKEDVYFEKKLKRKIFIPSKWKTDVHVVDAVMKFSSNLVFFSSTIKQMEMESLFIAGHLDD